MREAFVRHWGPEASLVGVAYLVVTPYLVLGPGFVLDDWFGLSAARFSGGWSAAGHDQWLARPAASVLYALTFGVLAHAPVALVLVQTMINASAAALFYRVLLAGRIPRPTAWATALVWLLLPNHTSLSFWPSAINIAAAAALMWGGVLVLLRSTRVSTEAIGALVLAAATLNYEAIVPVAFAAVVVLSGRSTRVRSAAWAAAGVLPSLAWMFVHWHPAKKGLNQTLNWGLLLPAHLGWGVWPSPVATALGLVSVLGAVAVGVRLTRRPLVRWTPSDHLFLAGWAVVVLGTLPFARYYFEPLGAGDRANVAASFGSAMVWAAMLSLVWAWRESLGRLVVAGATLGFVGGQWQASVAWSSAGRDADDLIDVVKSMRPCPSIVYLPDTPPRRNVRAVVGPSTARGLAQIGCDRESVLVQLDRR